MSLSKMRMSEDERNEKNGIRFMDYNRIKSSDEQQDVLSFMSNDVMQQCYSKLPFLYLQQFFIFQYGLKNNT